MDNLIRVLSVETLPTQTLIWANQVLLVKSSSSLIIPYFRFDRWIGSGGSTSVVALEIHLITSPLMTTTYKGQTIQMSTFRCGILLIR